MSGGSHEVRISSDDTGGSLMQKASDLCKQMGLGGSVELYQDTGMKVSEGPLSAQGIYAGSELSMVVSDDAAIVKHICDVTYRGPDDYYYSQIQTGYLGRQTREHFGTDW